MGVVRFALRLPHTFYVLAALILFLGITAIRAMPTDIFPEIRIPVVTVIWQETGLSTPEMERRVSTYSQYSISASVNGIKNMEAQTLDGEMFSYIVSNQMVEGSVCIGLRASRRVCARQLSGAHDARRATS